MQRNKIKLADLRSSAQHAHLCLLILGRLKKEERRRIKKLKIYCIPENNVQKGMNHELWRARGHSERAKSRHCIAKRSKYI